MALDFSKIMSREAFEAEAWKHPPEERPSWDDQRGLEYEESNWFCTRRCGHTVGQHVAHDLDTLEIGVAWD